ncbi:DUF3899 domain-containing protein [Psychrobacillus glaciei]|uniref:DUF3899 domain-containing protein n=1 Tax=Psychrobacillus glaciei TaxID=2283160 RepID=A0A5J6SKT1_9BACI|nr:DUF3899 domain-containing protein [Psychrobacillus glaciei]QFF98242.1 DUF3899 domain-containing protein [Psychrobacillus glaciei]
MKAKIFYFIGLQLLIFVLTFLIYGKCNLVYYANMSFYVGGLITFFGLMSYVVAGGFFDFFTESSRKVFTPKRLRKEVGKMRLPSEVFSFPNKPIIALGLSSLLCMCIALFVYYS